ncbi:hypothetical protein GCM10010912_64290 [Paenibacillus albidus]|uniref:SAF domain-containing protein n=1 Tax=Paenibacillus albidus TaxID=2041023 RepID=A0A917FUW3_9BACL|nr:SAF domain-containing protein [Paenibacillus albidus]GGG11004.1 hypothetical protein GCM10010912_64290 [Paenibacillus albidus]
MSTQRGHLLKRNYLFALLILITGFGGLLGYDLYFKPYVLSQTVVKIKVAEGELLPKNYELTSADLYLDSVQTKDIPSGVITEIDQVEHKITNVILTGGSILTESLVDVSDLEPAENEGIFPIPKEAIYAINGSLRSRDKVDIYLVEGDGPVTSGNTAGSGIITAGRKWWLSRRSHVRLFSAELLSTMCGRKTTMMCWTRSMATTTVSHPQERYPHRN